MGYTDGIFSNDDRDFYGNAAHAIAEREGKPGGFKKWTELDQRSRDRKQYWGGAKNDCRTVNV